MEGEGNLSCRQGLQIHGSPGRDALEAQEDQKRGLGVRDGFGSHMGLNSKDGPGRGSPGFMRDVLELGHMEECP